MVYLPTKLHIAGSKISSVIDKNRKLKGIFARLPCFYFLYYQLRSGNACYHSVQNLLSSKLLSTNLKIKIYRTIILPVVLYGCETWSLTLREERKLGVFETMVLRRIFGLRREEVTGKWRRLHNEELNDLYSSPNILCL